jgi:glutamate synthase (NADPH/NADH) small chain
MSQPGDDRPDHQPWPTYPMLFRVSSAHEEGGDRVYSASTKEFLGDDDGRVRALRIVEVDGKFQEIEGTEQEIPAQLVLFAMGFTGPESDTLVEQLGVELDERTNVARDSSYATSSKGVFVAGDAGRGQSLIVWAIAEGRAAAAAVDTFLRGSTTLPAPIPPTARPLVV